MDVTTRRKTYLIYNGSVSFKHKMSAILPTLILSGLGYLPHVQVKIVGARENKLIVGPAEAAAFHCTAVVVARTIKLANVNRALNVEKYGGQTTAQSYQLVARVVESNVHAGS